MASRGWLAVVLTCVASSAAHAQSGGLREERLYVGTHALMGSNRMVALGGAYVAVAEGTAGFTSNLAALAQRAPDNERGWDVGFALSWLDVPLVEPSSRDQDNDGRRDGARSSTQYLVGLTLQYQRFGVGTYLRSSVSSFCATGVDACPDDERVGVLVQHAALAGAMGIGREDVILGFALFVSQATFTYRHEPFSYSGNRFEIGALYRPTGQPFRIGVSIRPEVTGPFRPSDTQSATLAGRTPFAAVVSPGVLSVGGAMRLGKGAENFNRLSPAARANLRERFGEENLPPELPANAPTGRLLVSAQLDVFAPAKNAVPLASVVSDEGAPAPRVADVLLLEPRFGAEHETIPNRLRLLGGTYVEPAPFFGGGGLRPHLTGGAEVRVLHYLDDWALSASFDVAARYHAFGISVGFWR